ncbi:MAG: cell envelope integrity EipB family protein [Beijerinckiaceae bacterium]
MKVRFLFAAAALLAAGGAMGLIAASAAQAAPVELLPHRAVYDLSLSRTTPVRGIEGARGRIVYEGGGSACEGYTSSFRQVVQMEGSEIGTRLTDVRSTTFEEPGGKGFRFVIDRMLPGEPPGRTEGKTGTGGEAATVRLSKPKPGTVALPQGVTFPANHTRVLIEAAKAGDTTHTVKTYDGSDEGQAIYETTTIIGRAIRADVAAEAGDAGLLKSMSGMARWPMVISYFKAGSADMNPVYTMTMELYENGVARALRLDYGGLALDGKLAGLELGKMPKCD